MDHKPKPPLPVTEALKERVRYEVADLGDRRWVVDKNGQLVERHGPPCEGDQEVVRTVH